MAKKKVFMANFKFVEIGTCHRMHAMWIYLYWQFGNRFSDRQTAKLSNFPVI